MKLVKNILSLLFLVLTVAQLAAQIENPVHWELSQSKIDDTHYTLLYKAKIDEGWHLYSQHIEGDEGPIPTEFTINTEGVTADNFAIEPKGITKFDKTFEMEITYFEDQVIFKQPITLGEAYQDPLKVSVFFMVCDNERCLPPEEFSFQVGLRKPSAIPVQEKVITDRDQELSRALKIDIKNNGFMLNSYHKTSLWKIFFLGFFGGFIALLTPCVFPMIPLTVSFFSHSSSSKRQGLVKAVFYGVFIFLVYVLVSVPFHLLDSVNPDILNNISTSIPLNVAFFLIFIFFSISFFGFYEITLPSKWSNSIDNKATETGGILGVFLMAFTLALVSFSCTGPILGSLLGGALSNDGGAIQLTYGLAGFGLALALPFAFFALFPNLLKKLPNSGGWMTTVKAILGFLELGFAFKFLSNADLVAHWGILKREIFLGIWLFIALAMVAYLLGVFRLPHDSPSQKVTTPRKVLALLVLAFAGYITTGILPNNKAGLSLLSGFPPPTFYSIYTSEESHSPLQVKVFHDFELAVSQAKKINKPILIDFTGWACVNCRKMEENVWTDPKIKTLLENDVVLVSLYVDDRKELPVEEQFTYRSEDAKRIKEVRTVGEKWALFQTLNFQNNSQPYYVLMDSDYRLLAKPIGNTPDINNYLSWLSLGIAKLD